jgi:hypothetical protein
VTQSQVLASGVGSWPGEAVVEAARATFGVLVDDIPHLVELPGRGPGADLVGRGAVFLEGLPVDLQPSGWRLVDHPGRDLGRAQSFLHHDLDVLAEVADGYTGPLKLAVAGPWTLAVSLSLVRLERAVVDPGACRDIVDSLAAGLAQHVAHVARLVPGLVAALQGSVPTASGLGRLRAVDEQVAIEGLRVVLDGARAGGAARTVIHCCAAGPPVALLGRTGVDALSLDVSLLDTAGWEAVATEVEAGRRLWAGVVPTTGALPSATAAADAVFVPWRTLGMPAEQLLDVVLTPACGLAGGRRGGGSPADARTRLVRTREAARALTEKSV